MSLVRQISKLPHRCVLLCTEGEWKIIRSSFASPASFAQCFGPPFFTQLTMDLVSVVSPNLLIPCSLHRPAPCSILILPLCNQTECQKCHVLATILEISLEPVTFLLLKLFLYCETSNDIDGTEDMFSLHPESSNVPCKNQHKIFSLYVKVVGLQLVLILLVKRSTASAHQSLWALSSQRLICIESL